MGPLVPNIGALLIFGMKRKYTRSPEGKGAMQLSSVHVGIVVFDPACPITRVCSTRPPGFTW